MSTICSLFTVSTIAGLDEMNAVQNSFDDAVFDVRIGVESV